MSPDELPAPSQSRPDQANSPFEQARSILVQGPSGNPRAILQAYNSFQARWRIVQARPFEDTIDARTLAVILLLEYGWPDVFESIFDKPEIFFYLHAVITSIPNGICGPTEIDEVHDIELPPTKIGWLEESRDPNLARLVGALQQLSPDFDVNRLMKHLTLVDEPAPLGIHLDAPLTALMSGDPALIRFSQRVSGHTQNLQEILLEQLLDLVEDIRATSSGVKSVTGEEAKIVDQAGRAIFALGRVGDKTFIEALNEWMQNPDSLPMSLRLRAIYALGHHAFDRKRSTCELARAALVSVLKNAQASDSVRVRTARLLRWCDLPDEEETRDDQVRSVLELFRVDWDNNPSAVLRAVARETVLEGRWPHTALRLMTPEQYSARDICAVCSLTPEWPRRIGRYLVTLAASEDLISDTAMQLLVQYADKRQAIRWLVRLVISSDLRLQECLNHIGNLQRNLDRWQAVAWWGILRRVRWLNRLETWRSLISTLGVIPMGEAATGLWQLYDLVDEPRLKESIKEKLDDLSEAGLEEATHLLGLLNDK